MIEVREGLRSNMDAQQRSGNMRFAAAAVMIILTACVSGGIQPASSTPAELATTASKMPTLTKESYSPTYTHTQTETITPSETAAPADYQLIDWREPMEVITPENFERVEHIGRLEFSGTLLRFAWSPDGSKFGISVYYLGETSDSGRHKTHIFIANSLEEMALDLSGYGYVAFSYDGRILETGGSQYDLETGEEISHGVGTISYYPGQIMDIEFSANGEYIAAAGTEYVDLYPMGGDFRHGAFTREGADPKHASISPDSKTIAVDYFFESFVELWDPYSLTPVRILKLKDMGSGGKPQFYRNTNSLYLLASGKWGEGFSAFIQEWDYRTGKPLSVEILPGTASSDEMTLDLSPISDSVAFLSHEGKIFLLPIHDCHFYEVGKVGGEISRSGTLSFRPDGMLLATKGLGDNAIDFWGIPSSSSNGGAIEEAVTPSASEEPCPVIPMVAEQPQPKHPWWGE
jgi:WD40 repeat protein